MSTEWGFNRGGKKGGKKGGNQFKFELWLPFPFSPAYIEVSALKQAL
jgi:hypothetical protein